MSGDQLCYLAFMLRLWQVKADGERVWRASLESPYGGGRRGFASLDMLFAFLQEQTCTLARSQEQAEKDSR